MIWMTATYDHISACPMYATECSWWPTSCMELPFTKRTDLPVYQKDVETFEVKEADGRPVGILYLDYYPRDGKGAGAWCTDFRSQSWKMENGLIR